MDRVHVIRHKVLIEGQSVRRVARELGLSRVTVKKYLSAAEPRRRESKPRARPVSERIGPVIEEILESWAGRTTAKQRVTAPRVRREVLERGHAVGITTVKAYLAERRRKATEVYVPLVYREGELAEVDMRVTRTATATLSTGRRWPGRATKRNSTRVPARRLAIHFPKATRRAARSGGVSGGAARALSRASSRNTATCCAAMGATVP